MSTNQKTWTVGEALTQTELQRDATIGSLMDDRAWEASFTPGAVQKKILPMLEETASVNPRLLAIPSPTSGALRVQPALFVAGSPTVASQIAMAAKLIAALDTALFSSNSSGVTRYDLVYATINYYVSATGSRKIKDVNTAIVSTQTLNLEQAPQVVLTILPNQSQSTPLANMPADGTNSYNFPIALVTVANGFTSGSAIAQDSSGGSTYIAQLWNGGAMQTQRIRGPRPVSLYYGSANEKPSTSLAAGTQGAERWGMLNQFFGHFKVLPGTATSYSSGVIVDNSIDWRNRFVWGFWSYLGSATLLPLDAVSPALATQMVPTPITASGANSVNVYNSGTFPPLWTGAGVSTLTDTLPFWYTSGIGGTFTNHSMTVLASDGTLRLRKIGSLIDTTNGDLFCVVLFATDKLRING